MRHTKKNMHRNLLICVYGFYFVCIVCGIFLWNSYRERSFSQKEWMKSDPAKDICIWMILKKNIM